MVFELVREGADYIDRVYAACAFDCGPKSDIDCVHYEPGAYPAHAFPFFPAFQTHPLNVYRVLLLLHDDLPVVVPCLFHRLGTKVRGDKTGQHGEHGGRIESERSDVHLVMELAFFSQLFVNRDFIPDAQVVGNEYRIHSVMQGLVFLAGLELVELGLVGVAEDYRIDINLGKPGGRSIAPGPP